MRRHGEHAALVSLLSILIVAPAVSQIGVWEPVGPRSGFVDALEVDPTDGDRLYALQGGDLVRSVDGGLAWLPALALPADEILSVAVAPSEPSIVYAGTREGSVYRSLDGGVTWAKTAPIAESLDFVVSTLAVDPTDTDHVLAGSGVQGDEFVALSTDGGSTWSLATPGGELFVRDVVFDRGESSTVYAASSVALYRSLDGGATWAEVGRPGVGIDDLEAHPTESGTLFIATQGGVRKSTDGGETWRRLGGAEGPGFAGELAVDPADPERIFASGRWGLWRTDDGGASWTLQPSLLTSSPTRTRLFGIELSSHPPGTLFVLTATGILESLDGGASWRLRTPRGPDLLVHDLLALGKGPQRLFAATAEGLFVTEDGGESWSFVPGAGAVRVWSLAANGSPTPRLFVATDSALLATEDGGETFEDITFQGIGPHLLAADRVRPDTLYFWTGDLAMLFRSRDGGESWTQVTEAENNEFHALVPHATRADALFGTASCFFISEDPCGGTWVSFDGWSTRETLRESGGADLAFRPPQTLFLTENGFRAGVLRSTDLGGTWELVSEELDLPRVSKLLIDPTDPSVVFAVAGPEPGEPAGPGLIATEDGGDTWDFLGESLPEGVEVQDLEIDSRRPELLFAATTGGVYRLQFREVSDPPEPPAGPWLESEDLAGFRVKVRITAAPGVHPEVRAEPVCIPETLCASGAVPGRSEVFVRIVGPKPNGFLWPTLVKFSTSTVEVWIEQTSSGILRYYVLEGASPGVDVLPGLFDRTGFSP